MAKAATPGEATNGRFSNSATCDHPHTNDLVSCTSRSCRTSSISEKEVSMKQYEVISSMLADYLKQSNMHMDICTDTGATSYERAMSALVASRSLSMVSTLATELHVMVRANKLNQEAIDLLEKGEQ